MGIASVARTVAGAGPIGENPFAPALAGGPSSTGDVGVDTRFGPVNVGGLFGSPAGSNDPQRFVLPAVIAGVALLAAAFIFRRR